ncbi:MAG: hypothetical protein AMK73_06860, partial [Planctomycetes bacterium SM23_32]
MPPSAAPGPDLWELAQQSLDVLRFSTLFTSRQVPKYLSDDDAIGRAISWCKERGITRVYLESFRQEEWAPPEMLARARDLFLEAGVDARGCITPAGFAKQSTGWRFFSCFTNADTRRVMREMSEHAAGIFDVVMIDDFFCSDCTCEECRAARGSRSWSDYKRAMMLEVARELVIEAGKAVNPDVKFIIKYPAWYEMYQERGYDVAAESELFPMTWVGTETRGTDEPDPEAHFPGDPQYQACWLMRWLLGIGGRKCGGGWYDTIETSPRYYVEQGRQTVLGGAPEAFLFNFGAIYEGAGYDRGRGPVDMEALTAEMPAHFALARLIHGRRPRGLSGWKPPNSSPGADRLLHPLLGMAGFPVTAAHGFEPEAEGHVFGYHVLHDPAWWDAVEQTLEGGCPLLVTPAFLEAIRCQAEGNRLDLERLERGAVVLPPLEGRGTWAALDALSAQELNALRDRACGPLGVRFHAPAGVALYLFDDDVAVLESFRDEPAACELRLDGWKGVEAALTIPLEVA